MRPGNHNRHYQTDTSDTPRRGRPRTADPDRPVTLTVRVTPQLFDTVYQSARSSGAPSLSAYVRHSLRTRSKA